MMPERTDDNSVKNPAFGPDFGLAGGLNPQKSCEFDG
jgi:hypothetical protein